MKPDELVVVDLSGKTVKGDMPSVEVRLHTAVYTRRKDCQAVIHAHPPVATGFALAGEEIPDNLMPESAIVLGSVAVVPFAMPGSVELVEAIEPLLDDHKTFLISHHGALAMGKDIFDAYNRMETLERIAKIYMNAKLIGTPKPVPDDAFDYLLEHALNGNLE
jgi:L-fuculose-phosphate aldolase